MSAWLTSMNEGPMKIQSTASFKPTRFRRPRLLPALLCALLAAPPAWSQSLKAPGAGPGLEVPRLGATPAPAQAPSAAAADQRVRPIDAIVAVVNNEVITARELESRLQTVEGRLRNQGVAVPPRAQFQQQLLERMIVDRAQLQLAKESGLRVEDPLLDAAVARIAEQNGMTLAAFR